MTGRLGFVWVLLVSAALIPSAHGAQSVTLAWDPSPSTNVAGYNLYYGRVSSGSTNTIDVGGAKTNTVSGLQEARTYFFFVKAYNSARIESDPSNVINYSVPGTNTPPTISSITLNPVGSVTLTWPAIAGKTYRVVYKTSLSAPTWTPLSPDVISTGTTASRSDYVVGNRFYSVIQLP